MRTSAGNSVSNANSAVRSPVLPHARAPGVTSHVPSAETLAEWREAVELWLRWNSAYDEVTASMYQLDGDLGSIEDLMDRLDQLRIRAVELSEKLVA